MILRFSGLLDADTLGNPPQPKIGDRYVLAEITDEFGYEKRDVTVVLGNDWFKRVDLDADTGSSHYSELTPGEDAKLFAGDVDVLERLDDLDGQVVTLIVADEPLPASSDRSDLLERAEQLARDARQGSNARGYAGNTAGNVATHREALVEELEALRLTMLALFGPLAEAVDLGLALLRSDGGEL